MAARYNNLVQIGKINPYTFTFKQRRDTTWHCCTADGTFEAGATRKRDAKDDVMLQICSSYDMDQARPNIPDEDPGRTVWILVDADSLSNTLKALARYKDIEWLVVQGFSNEATVLPDDLPWTIYRSEGTLREAADHYLTWHTAQLVLTLGVPSFFIIVSRDAALQNTVQLIKKAGHQAVFCPRDLKSIHEVLALVGASDSKK